MTAYDWLGRFRQPLRAAVFRMFRQLLETDDGRRILSDGLKGQLAQHGVSTVWRFELDESPYADLGKRASRSASARPNPVFITSRFRSGSTLFWNIFRHVPGCTAYYEPFNERRWFDPAARGDRIDSTHVGVSDYWREYEGLGQLGRLYNERWIDRHLFMDTFFDDPNMKQYVDELIGAASGCAVLQFNRIDFRLPWFRRLFPDTRLLHVYRHPRDQWCSSLVRPSEVPRDLTVEEFEHYDHFYLLSWARDLSYQFPFLEPSRVGHPYDLFYLIWKLSYLFGRIYAHASFCFEEMLVSPDRELTRLMHAADVGSFDLGLLKGLLTGQTPGKWRVYADDDWYRAREERCETALAEFFAEPVEPWLQQPIGARPMSGMSA